MMGKQDRQIQMIILDIDSMIPQDHLLRQIKKVVLIFRVKYSTVRQNILPNINLLFLNANVSIKNIKNEI